MRPNDGVLLALLTLLVVFVAARCGSGGLWPAKPCDHPAPDAEAFTPVRAGMPRGSNADPHHDYEGGDYNPYTVLNKQLSSIRGMKHDAYNQPPLWRQPRGLDRYHRSGANIKPEQIAAAERAAWFGQGSRPEFDPETTHSTSAATEHTDSGAGMNYGDYIADLVVDPRTRENHAKWVQEMKPWGGGPLIVDTADEIQETTQHFVGLRRVQAVAQYNPLQLTERDTYTFASNPKFNFRG